MVNTTFLGAILATSMLAGAVHASSTAPAVTSENYAITFEAKIYNTDLSGKICDTLNVCQNFTKGQVQFARALLPWKNSDSIRVTYSIPKGTSLNSYPGCYNTIDLSANLGITGACKVPHSYKVELIDGITHQSKFFVSPHTDTNGLTHVEPDLGPKLQVSDDGKIANLDTSHFVALDDLGVDLCYNFYAKKLYTVGCSVTHHDNGGSIYEVFFDNNTLIFDRYMGPLFEPISRTGTGEIKGTTKLYYKGKPGGHWSYSTYTPLPQ